MEGYAPVGLAVLFTLAVLSLGAGIRLVLRGIQERRAWRRERAPANGGSRRWIGIAAAVSAALVAAAAVGLFAASDFRVSAQEDEQRTPSPPSGLVPPAALGGHSARGVPESKRPSNSTRSRRKEAPNPNDIEVAVLNAAGITGLATDTSSQLLSDDFGIGTVRDAPEPLDRSLVMYGSDARREARLVGRKLEISKLKRASDEVETVARGADVMVLLGGEGVSAAGADADTGG